MTRETKIGLLVALSFLCLVGVVVAAKLRQPEDMPGATVAASTKADGSGGEKQKPPSSEPNKAPRPDIEQAKHTSSETKGGLDLPAPPAAPAAPEIRPPGVPDVSPGLPLPGGPERVAANPLPAGDPPPPVPQIPSAPPDVPLPSPLDTTPEKDPKAKPVASNPDLGPPPGVPTPPKETTPPKVESPAPPPAPDNLGPPAVEPPATPKASVAPKSVETPEGLKVTDPPGVPAPPTPSPGPPSAPIPAPENSGPPAAPLAPPGNPGPPAAPAPPNNPASPAAPLGPPNSSPAPNDPIPAAPVAPPSSPNPPLSPPAAGNPAVGNPPGNPARPSIDAPAPPKAPTVATPFDNTRVKSYSVEAYRSKPGDTLASVSTKVYGSDKYSRALLLFNREDPRNRGVENLTREPVMLAPNQPVYYPPKEVLEAEPRFAALIGSDTPARPAPPPNAPTPPPSAPIPPPGAPNPPQGGPGPGSVLGTPTPLITRPGNPNNTAAPPAAPVPNGQSPGAGDNTKRYRVGDSGEHILEIARKTLGDQRRWPAIYQLNPSIRPEYPIPGGTELRLPVQ